jgi:hypothetical protein
MSVNRAYRRRPGVALGIGKKDVKAVVIPRPVRDQQ